MNLAVQKADAVRSYLDHLKEGLPWRVMRHRTDPGVGHIVNRLGYNVTTNLSLGVAEFIVERVNREE